MLVCLFSRLTAVFIGALISGGFFFLTTHYNEMEKYLAIMIKWVHEVLSCFQLGIMSLPVLCILLFDWIIWELDDFGYCC